MRSNSLNAVNRADLGLALLRATTGAIFVAHGAQKLFIYGVAGVTGGFAQMGIPMPGIAGPATGLVELIGGVALMLGLFTRLAGFGLAMTMLGAIGFVHLAAGFFAPNGIEFPLALLGATSALAISGAGRYSLDALRARGRDTLAERAPTVRPLQTAA